MDIQNQKKKAWLKFFTVLLLCGILVTLAIGTAFARYEKSLSAELQMKYQAKTEQIYIRSIEEQGLDKPAALPENTYQMNFVLSNGNAEDTYCDYDQTATLSLFATLGLENPENFVIMLSEGGICYQSRYEQVLEGTSLYTQYGPGWIYRFYNADGEEISWLLSGTGLVEKQMTITITGISSLPTALNLIANSKPE